MSQLYVDNIRNRTGGPIGIPTGAVVTGVLTATTANVTGNMTVGGVLTYEDVTNIDSVGIITAQSGIKGNSGGWRNSGTGQAGFLLVLLLLKFCLVMVQDLLESVHGIVMIHGYSVVVVNLTK
jgi:hypothetical protein